MRFIRNDKLIRTDMWREGEWLDLWSVVHLLSGASIGFTFFLLPFTHLDAVIIAFLGLIGYEMWEKMVQIEETLANHTMDVVVGMTSFLLIYLFIAPRLSMTLFILIFGLTLTADVVMSVFGWTASSKAAALQAQLRTHNKKRRARFLARRALRAKSRL